MKRTIIAAVVTAASLISAVAATAQAIRESNLASTAEASLSTLKASHAAFLSKLYGACSQSADFDSMTQAQAQACVGLAAAFAREDGKSEPAALAQALSFLKPSEPDTGRNRVRSIVHEVYTDFAPLNPSQVYGAVYEQVTIADKFAGAFKQD